MRRRILYQYRGLIAGIELVVLLSMVLIGVAVYRIELARSGWDYEIFKRQTMDWDRYCSASGENAYYIFEYLNNVPGREKYGVSMSLEKEGDVTIYRTEVMNYNLSWRSAPEGQTEEEETEETELIQLDLHFSDTELDALASFFRDYKEALMSGEGGDGMGVQKMRGYYDEAGKFVPVRVIFKENGSGDEIYTLANEKAEQEVSEARLFWRINVWRTDPADDGEGGSAGAGESASVREEYGEGWLSFNSSRRDYNEKALQRMWQKDSAYLLGSPSGQEFYQVQVRPQTGGEIRSYTVAFYADLPSITLASHRFFQDIIQIAVFCQLAGVVVLICVIHISRRQSHLQQMRNTFINAVAHEMKTPAAVLKNGVECIRAGIYPEKQAHYMELVEREADHLSSLLNAMLTYSRLVDGSFQWRKEPVDLPELCRRVWEYHKAHAQEKGIVFELEEQAVFCLRGNPDLLEMVLDNYFSNAVRHCTPGGTIHLTVGRTAFYLSNTGQHIPDDCIDRIWEPLYQVDKARSRKTASSGMGLAISAQILQYHRLRYGARNLENGVEFYFGR